MMNCLAKIPTPSVGRAVLTMCLVALAGRTASAQSMDAQAGAGVLFESYTFRAPLLVDLEKVSLLTMPITARVALTPRLEFGLNGAYASAIRTRRAGQSTTISGLTDTELHLSYRLAGDKLRLTALALAPTGKSKLTVDEMEVSGLVASDLLPFAISNWGSGGGLGLSAALTVPVADETSVGLSAGYVMARAYEPLSAATYAFRPGNQLEVRGTLSRMFGVTARASLQLTYLHFTEDQTAGANFYQTGDRLQAVGSVAFAAGPGSTGVAYAGYLQRKVGQFTKVVDVTPAQSLVYAGTGFREPMGAMILIPSLDVRFLGSDQGVGQGRNVSAGLGAEVTMGDVQLVPLVRGRVGKLTIRTGQESSFTGFEVGLSIRHQAIPR